MEEEMARRWRKAGYIRAYPFSASVCRIGAEGSMLRGGGGGRIFRRRRRFILFRSVIHGRISKRNDDFLDCSPPPPDIQWKIQQIISHESSSFVLCGCDSLRQNLLECIGAGNSGGLI